MTNSRRKGAQGEREWAGFLRSHGFEARRGRQFRGTPDSPDVICEDLPIHWEVKRVERLSLYKALEQAISEAPEGSVPAVAHRRSNDRGKKALPWVVALRADDFLSLLAGAEGFQRRDRVQVAERPQPLGNLNERLGKLNERLEQWREKECGYFESCSSHCPDQTDLI